MIRSAYNFASDGWSAPRSTLGGSIFASAATAAASAPPAGTGTGSGSLVTLGCASPGSVADTRTPNEVAVAVAAGAVEASSGDSCPMVAASMTRQSDAQDLWQSIRASSEMRARTASEAEFSSSVPTARELACGRLFKKKITEVFTAALRAAIPVAADADATAQMTVCRIRHAATTVPVQQVRIAHCQTATAERALQCVAHYLPVHSNPKS
jgi:hypothetical protein